LAEKILALHAVENPTVRSRKTDASQAKNTLPKMAMHRVR